VVLFKWGSLHRPSQYSNSPDIAIINVKSRSDTNVKCLSTQFSSDDGYYNTKLFYVYYSNGIPEIKPLLPYKTKGFPLMYKCQDKIPPEPGCSGSPIIQARVMFGRNPKWQFKVVGVVYAKCNDKTKNSYFDANTEKLVCAIPVINDLEQVFFQVLILENDAIRYQQLAEAACRVNDGAKLREYTVMVEQCKRDVSKNLKEFEDGVTSLDIELQDGLEKLLGKTIINLKFSMLLKKWQEKYEGYEFSKIIENEKELQEKFNFFIEKIKGIEMIELRKDDNFILSECECFRVDVKGSIENSWTLELQDNTGKKSGKPIQLTLAKEHKKALYADVKQKPNNNLEPASSVFAIVKVLNGTQKILGNILAETLKDSAYNCKSINYEDKLKQFDIDNQSTHKNQPFKTQSKIEKEKRTKEFYSKQLEEYDAASVNFEEEKSQAPQKRL